MLETLYLHATATDAERLLLCLESHLQDQLTAATVISVVLDMDPQEDFEIPPEDSSGQWQRAIVRCASSCGRQTGKRSLKTTLITSVNDCSKSSLP